MRRLAQLVLLVLAATVALSGGAAPARAVSDATVALPLSGFKDLEVDSVHKRLFVSGGGTDSVVVRDFAGAAVGVLPSSSGARHLALSPDSSTLYVTLPTAGDVVAYDTVTLLETARYAVGTCPMHVAVASGKIWVGYGCSEGNVAVIDPAAVPPTVTLDLVPANYFYSYPGVASTPAQPGLLVLWDITLSGEATIADVSSGALVLGVRKDINAGDDLAFTADGTRFVIPSHHIYRTSDLGLDGRYPIGNAYCCTGATVAATGLVATSARPAVGPDLWVWRSDRSLVRGYDLGTADAQQSSQTHASGLSFSADASRLFVVTTDYLGKTVRLRVLHDPHKSVSAITLTKPASAAINKPFSITGKLSSSLAIPGGRTITVQRDSTYGTVNLASRSTAADGSFTITDTLTKRGAYGYRATWAGDASHAASTMRITFYVTGLATTVSITTGPGPYKYGARPLVVAHLGAAKVRTLSIYAQPYGGTKTLIKKGTVDANGNLSVAYTMTRRTVFTASFGGDYLYEPRYSAKALTSYAKVVNSLVGYYGTSGSYKLYRTSVDPTLAVTVYPNNARTCVRFEAEVYRDGAWRDADYLLCEIYLNSNSQAAATFSTNAPAGTRYRLRAIFHGNNRNVKTPGPWQYLRFT